MNVVSVGSARCSLNNVISVGVYIYCRVVHDDIEERGEVYVE